MESKTLHVAHATHTAAQMPRNIFELTFSKETSVRQMLLAAVQGKNQRTMKRDFKQSRPDKWSERSRPQPERSEYDNEV